MFKFVEYWAIFVKWFVIYLLTRKEKKRAVTLKQYASSFEIGISKFHLNNCRYLWVSLIEAENILGQKARRWFSIRYGKKCFVNVATASRKNWFFLFVQLMVVLYYVFHQNEHKRFMLTEVSFYWLSGNNWCGCIQGYFCILNLLYFCMCLFWDFLIYIDP